MSIFTFSYKNMLQILSFTCGRFTNIQKVACYSTPNLTSINVTVMDSKHLFKASSRAYILLFATTLTCYQINNIFCVTSSKTSYSIFVYGRSKTLSLFYNSIYNLYNSLSLYIYIILYILCIIYIYIYYIYIYIKYQKKLVTSHLSGPYQEGLPC